MLPLLNTTIICNSCGRDQRTGSQFAPLLQRVSDDNAPTTANSSQAQSTRNAQRETSQFQLYHHSYSPPQHYPQAAIESPTRQELPIQQYQRQDPTRANVTILKRIIMIVAVLVIAGSVGMFALMYYSTSTSTRTKSNATETISSRNSNPTQNVNPGSSPVISTNPTHTTKSTTTILTCPVNSSHIGSFTFSGAVTGTISLSTFAACSSDANACYLSCSNTFQSGGHSYYGIATGKINGTTYRFEFLINPYLKPDTYTSATNTSVVLMENNHEWESYGVSSNRTSIIVNNHGKTGSIHAIISMISPQFDPSSVVVVTGNWSQ